MPSLEAQLEAALMDAMQGDAWSPLLAGRLQREARAVLMRHGLGQARVTVSYQRGVVQVDIGLPPGPRRVRQLTLRLASG
jgi:hypothetical protein